MQTGVSNIGSVKFDELRVVPVPCSAVQKKPCHASDEKYGPRSGDGGRLVLDAPPPPAAAALPAEPAPPPDGSESVAPSEVAASAVSACASRAELPLSRASGVDAGESLSPGAPDLAAPADVFGATEPAAGFGVLTLRAADSLPLAGSCAESVLLLQPTTASAAMTVEGIR